MAEFDGLSNSHYRRLTALRFLPVETRALIGSYGSYKGAGAFNLCLWESAFYLPDFRRGIIV